MGLQLRRGEQLRIIDPQGGQSGDLVAFSQDGRQRLSNGRTFDYGGKSIFRAGTSSSDRVQYFHVGGRAGRREPGYRTSSISRG
jgi:uncharacterized protein YcgI (DUF1989 family)